LCLLSVLKKAVHIDSEGCKKGRKKEGRYGFTDQVKKGSVNAGKVFPPPGKGRRGIVSLGQGKRSITEIKKRGGDVTFPRDVLSRGCPGGGATFGNPSVGKRGGSPYQKNPPDGVKKKRLPHGTEESQAPCQRRGKL